MILAQLKRLWQDSHGSTVVEYAVVLPLFLSLTFGLVQAGLLLYTQSGLQHGVEVAARCASVNYAANRLGLNQSCFYVGGAFVAPSAVTTTTIQQYAAENSFGMVPVYSSFNVTFTAPPSTGSVVCPSGVGYQISASVPVDEYIFSLTLTANSSFPVSCS